MRLSKRCLTFGWGRRANAGKAWKAWKADNLFATMGYPANAARCPAPAVRNPGCVPAVLLQCLMVSRRPTSTPARRRSSRSAGPAPVLLLHGFPQTHLMWREIAPALAERFTVVCADLRGYGASGCPLPPDHAPYSKRAMARDMVK